MRDMTTKPWEDLDISKEEYEADKADWMAQVQHYVAAIDCGYLDDALGKIAAACFTRQAEIGLTKLDRNTGKTAGKVTVTGAIPPGETTTPPGRQPTPVEALTVGVEPDTGEQGTPQNHVMKPQPEAYSVRNGYYRGSDGNLYYKKQVNGAYFTVTRPIDPRLVGALMQVEQVDRTRAKVIVRQTAHPAVAVGQRFTMDIGSILEEVLSYNAAVGTKAWGRNHNYPS